MATDIRDETILCERLHALGYARHKHIRMYGEELEVISNPTPEENGFAIEVISRKSGIVRRMRIPLSVVHMIARDIASKSARKAA